MDKLLKILKIILLLLAITIGIGILGGLFFLYNGLKSGNLKSYTTKAAIEILAPDTELTPTQEEMLEAEDFEGLVTDLEENITPTQINCAVEILGQDRANELMITKEPTPQEIFALSKCL